MQDLTPPTLNSTGFVCPHCHAFAEQRWYSLTASSTNDHRGVAGWLMSVCRRCERYTFWEGEAMVYPDSSILPPPNEDMPAEIQTDYGEASSIAAKSARGAAALLRLCIQKICVHLKKPGKDLNSDIAALVKDGLNPKIQRSLDVVRVIGNEAVHPGTIDLRDSPAVAGQLATLVNIIVDTMITQPGLVDKLYEQLPTTKKEQISKRDAAAATTN